MRFPEEESRHLKMEIFVLIFKSIHSGSPFKCVASMFAYISLLQILNVYIPKYEGGGHFWPIVHKTTIFSLVLTQIIAIGVFGIKRSPIASGFTFPLVICTLLFNEYCRQRFAPVFKRDAVQVLNRFFFLRSLSISLSLSVCVFTKFVGFIRFL